MATRPQTIAPNAAVFVPGGTGAKRPTVLVVDDSPEFLELACLLVEKSDMADVVATAGDGAEAIRAVLQHHPDVILMDVEMPRMSGLVSCAILSLAFSRVKVVLMSAENTPGMRTQCRESGAHAFLNKVTLIEDLPLLLEDLDAPGPRS